MQRTDLLLHCFLGENRADDAASRIGVVVTPVPGPGGCNAGESYARLGLGAAA